MISWICLVVTMKTIKGLIAERIKSDRAIKSIRREDLVASVYAKYPELKKTDDELIDLREERIFAAIEHDKESIPLLDKREEELKKYRDEFIKKNGIDPLFDDEKELCGKCHDTGFITLKNGSRAVCRDCMKEELNECFDSSGMGDFRSYTLKSFDFAYFGDAGKRKEVFSSVKEMFEDRPDRQLLKIYSGGTQTGKTYLSVVLAKYAIIEGKSAFYVKAEDLEERDLRYDEGVTDSDFLVIDDYSAAITGNRRIASSINGILESRCASGRATLVVSSEPHDMLVGGSDVRIAGKLSKAGRICG